MILCAWQNGEIGPKLKDKGYRMKLGKKIRTPKRMMEIHSEGSAVLMCKDRFGISVVRFDYPGDFAFADVMDGIKNGHFYELPRQNRP